MIWDIKTFKIPNALSASGAISGLIYNYINFGVKGFCQSFVGIMLPIIFLIILFYSSVLGAGDIKLMAAIGAFVRIDIFWIMMLTFLITAVMGAIIVLRGILICVFNYYRYGELKSVLYTGCTKIHMSIPITVGTVVWLIGGS